MNHLSISSYVVLPAPSFQELHGKRPAVDALHPGTRTG
jgi:hypothetical protein